MRRTRTPASLLRRLDALSAATDADVRRGGVMLVPPIAASFDEWEAIAIPAQRALMQASSEDTQRRTEVLAPEPLPGPFVPLVEGIHFHTPDPNRPQRPRPKETTP